ncbi:hypothetical protein RJT34_05718 [Clitoria ternatea]|uniref:Uncharacterized protein n=1 Tax=Clitoria ternatea TaxID=43366 RepID=A0AAN9PRD9_CLITE
MNEQAKKNEVVNSQNTVERKVETVDHRSSAGQSTQEERNVQVVHQPHSTKTSGGVLAGAAAAVATTLQSAKEAISKK